MNWSDERYVRVYTRDTPEWQCLSFLAKGLFLQLLRKVDRAGVLPLGKLGRRAVAVAVGHPGEWSRLEEAFEELLADGCVQVHGDLLLVPNFIEAQEAEASDAARARKHRECVRDRAKAPNRVASRNVTPASREVESRDGGITNRDGGITERAATVTPSLPSLPNQPPEEKRETTVSRLPSRHEALARLYPATAALVEASGGRFAHPSKPETKTAVEAAIAALPLEVALAAAQRSFERHGKTHLGWCLDDLVAAARPASAGQAEPQVDLSWLDQVPEGKRAEARAAWAAKAAEVQQTFAPPAVPRVLASSAEALRQEFLP